MMAGLSDRLLEAVAIEGRCSTLPIFYEVEFVCHFEAPLQLQRMNDGRLSEDALSYEDTSYETPKMSFLTFMCRAKLGHLDYLS